MKKLFSLFLVAVSSLLFAVTGCRHAEDDAKVNGGVTRRSSYDAPKVILSTEIIALETKFFLLEWEEGGYSDGGSYWFFGVRREGEGFLLTAKSRGLAPRTTVVDSTFLRNVHAIILKHDLPRLNGFDEVTSGLAPQCAPCSLAVDYASGERLYFQKNGNPRAGWANDLKALFLRALNGV